jgi:hypothetical protein
VKQGETERVTVIPGLAVHCISDSNGVSSQR